MVVQCNEAGNIHRYRVQLPQEENQAGRISGDHGRNHPLGWVGGCYQALLPQRKAQPSADGDRKDAADVSASDSVQPVRPCNRGCHLWQLCHAEIYRDRLHDGSCSGWNNAVQIPPSFGSQWPEQAVFWCNQPLFGANGAYDEGRKYIQYSTVFHSFVWRKISRCQLLPIYSELP